MIDLQKSPETFLSGALPRDYVKLWGPLPHKGFLAPSKKSKSSKDDPTTESEYWQELFSYTRDSSDARRASLGYEERRDFPNPSNFDRTIRLLKYHGFLRAPNSIKLSDTHRLFYDAPTTLPTYHLEEPEYLYAVGVSVRTIQHYRRKNRQWDEINVYRGPTYQETIEAPRKRIIAERFAVLAQREDNWDGYDSKKPTEQTLTHARAVIDAFVNTIISNGHVLLTPFISTDEAGHITVQWNKKPRELHLHITQQETQYLKVWGPNINTEMEEGILNSDKYTMLWEWLTL